MNLPTWAGWHDIARLAILTWLMVTWPMVLMLTPTSIACGQYSDSQGTMRTKDTGLGILDVDYFLESSGADSEGMLHVTASSIKGPATIDRNLEIVFYSDSVGLGANSDLAIHFQLTLPEGSQSASTSVPFFLYGGAMYSASQSASVNWDVAVFENGKDIEESRSIQIGNANSALVRGPGRASVTSPYHTAHRTQSSSSTLHILEDDTFAPSAQAIRIWLAQEQGGIGNVLTATMLSDQPSELTRDSLRVHAFRPRSSLPVAWQYYLQFRMLVIEDSTLARLIAEQPAVSEALKRYLAAGGNLLLLGDQNSHCAQTLDDWLEDTGAGDSKRPVAKSLAWQSVTLPIDDWWNRDATGRPRTMETARSGRTNSVLATEANLNMIAKILTVGADYRPQPLTTAGVLRDAFTLTETFAEVKYGGMRRSIMDLYRLILEDVSIAGINPTLAIGGAMVMEPEAAEPAPLVEGADAGAISYPILSLDIEWMLPYVWQSVEDSIAARERADTTAVGVRPYLLGRVGYMQPGLDRFPQETLTAVTNYLAPSIAVGVHTMQDKLWTFRNLIDTVGKPPVWTFCAIVLAFGMLLGPGLLVFTAWMRRRSLLIFLVPCCSFIATVAIAAYEVLHDGFTTHSRISAVVAVDDGQSEAFVWSRQTYFSGRPPREGLIFPNDVYFRPVDAEISMLGRSYRQRRGEIHPREATRSHIFVDDRQAIWQEGLRAREQQQFLIGNPVKFSVPIRITRVDRELVSIENLTDETIPFVFARDGGDGYFLIENVPARDKAEAVRSSTDSISGLLTRLRAQNLPDVPDGVRQLGRWTGIDDQKSAVEVIDRIWSECFNEDPSAEKLPPFGYAALLTRCDAAYKPIKAEHEQGLYLVVGRTHW